MNSNLVRALGIVGLFALASSPMGAQQAVGTTGPANMPTKENPLRFRAVNVSLNAGEETVTDIVIERWTTIPERTALLKLAEQAKLGQEGQRQLLDALQKVEPRAGFIRTPSSLGWDLKYAFESVMDDGTRQIVIATDKLVSFAAAATDATSQDYPFTLIEMHMKPNDKGEGKMLPAASITTKNGRIELENYGNQPILLTSITEEKKK